MEFGLTSGQREPFSFSKLLTPEGTVRTVVVGSSPVIFNVTSSMESFISVTFIILNPVSLIGTTITCNADSLHVNISSRSASKSSVVPQSTLATQLCCPRGKQACYSQPPGMLPKIL